MEWLELSTLVDREAVEPVAELFTREGYGGAVIEEAIVPERGGDGYSLDLSRPVLVKTYLPSDDEAPQKQRAIAEALWHLGRLRGVAPLQTKTIAEEDWANAWREHYQVHRVGKHLVIKPSWQEYQPKQQDVVLELDPGMAFGTGLHPTTQLCMRALEQYLEPGAHVLDVGTGSGILAIAAAKLGARQVKAVDVDSVAVTAAKANIARNDLTETITVAQGSLETAGGQFDLVVANITARVIAALASQLAGVLAPEGKMILSGIIADQVKTVRSALREAGLAILVQRASGDWRAIVARRSS